MFEPHLPSAAPAALPVEGGPEKPPATSPRSGAARTLLYIEDDPVNAMIMNELLASRRDLVVHVADTGSAGLDLARRPQPGLILLDMQLPDLGGLEVLSRLRAAGIDGYWSKPIDHGALLAALDGLFERVPAEAPR